MRPITSVIPGLWRLHRAGRFALLHWRQGIVEFLKRQETVRPVARWLRSREAQASARVELEDASASNRVRMPFVRETLPRGGIAAEIGVHKGFFTRVLLDIAAPARLHLIDPWYLVGREWTWGKGNRSTTEAVAGILRAYENELVRGQVVLNVADDLEILPTFPDGYFDWVYLDTSHRYEQTMKELHALRPKVKATGIIAGDDWRPDPTHMHHGACKAVREFVEQEPYELVYSNDRDGQWAIRLRAEERGRP